MLVRQFLFIKELASMTATLPGFDGADNEQLEGVVDGCDVSLDHLYNLSNYFGFPVGYVPRTTLETISGRISNILGLAETVEERVKSFLDDITGQEDRKEALGAKVRSTKQDLLSKTRRLEDLNIKIDGMFVSVDASCACRLVVLLSVPR